MKDDVKGWASHMSVVDEPQLLLLGNDKSSRCLSSPPGLTKWCYNVNCSVRTHTKLNVEPGLYVKSKGPSNSTHLSPFVPMIWKVKNICG